MPSSNADSCTWAKRTKTTHQPSDRGGAFPEWVSSGSEGESVLGFSPFTPSLTTSTTPGSSVNASPVLSPQLDTLIPEYDFLASCLASERTAHENSRSQFGFGDSSSSYESEPDIIHSILDVDSGRPGHVPAARNDEIRLPPPVVEIPPANASDFILDKISQKRAHKRVASARTRTSKRKTQSRREHVRFCFVSVQRDHQDEEGFGDNAVTLTERMDEDSNPPPFEHGPSEFPPRQYPGGEYAVSPLQPKADIGRIPASMLDYLPVLEARVSRLEYAIERYVGVRSAQALRNSILPERHMPPKISN